MIYVVGVCLIAKLASRHLHRKNESMQVDNTVVTPSGWVRVENSNQPSVIIKVAK